MNLLYLKYSYLNSLSLSVIDNSALSSILSLMPFNSPFADPYSSLFLHSRRCLFLSQFYGFSSELCSALLFHNIYGTNSLRSNLFQEYLYPSDLNRGIICSLLGCKTEYLVYEYSRFNQSHFLVSSIDLFHPTLQIMYFINTLEILSCIQDMNRPHFRNKLSLHLPHLRSIARNPQIASCYRSQMFADYSLLWFFLPPSFRLVSLR